MSTLQAAHQDRWNVARRRYAGFWQGAVLQDWFKVFIFPSSDSEYLREIDIASSVPELAEAVANLRGGVPPQPQDLLIGIGKRMGNADEPNDPEAWAAIDAGQFVCHIHYDGGDRRRGWKQRNLLLSAASCVAFASHPACREMTYTVVDGGNSSSSALPKIQLLIDYLVIVAAGECYREDGPAAEPKDQVARFCEEHELTWQTILIMGQIAQARQMQWSGEGPLETIRIASLAAELLTEAQRRATIPPVAATAQS
ncbi:MULTISPECIES: hypothetical protein [unclassified Bradyrhizobium]